MTGKTSRQAMYLRMITASVARRKSRMLIALLAVVVGATVLSGLVTIYYDRWAWSFATTAPT